METNNYIEDYFNNKLTEEDRSVFEERLTLDEDFAREVKDHALLMNAFDEAKAGELLQQFGALEEELNITGNKRNYFSVYMKWAATVVLLAVVSFLVYLSNTGGEEDLFLAYYTAYPNVENPVSRAESGQQDVWLFYEQGNYAEAAKLFKRQVVKNDADFSSWFYLGICELEQSRNVEAKNAFEKVIAQKDNKYFEQAQWYIALSYLHEGAETKTKRELEKIIASESTYSKKAKALLAEME